MTGRKINVDPIFRNRVTGTRKAFQFKFSIFRISFLSSTLASFNGVGNPPAFDVREFIVSHECVEQHREHFKSMQKSQTIKVNGKISDYTKISLNDSSSSSAVITLSLSRSNVRLSMLNISYTNLLLLDLSFNGLETLGDIGNETFPSLRLFNLSHNSLSSVKSHLFHHLKELEILDLSYNCFANFHYNEVFLRHEHLQKLFLNDNRLYRIQSMFREPKMMSLDVLDFSNNFVSDFSNYAIQIKQLNMRNNTLTSVSIFHASEMTLNAQNNNLVNFFAPRGTFTVLNLSNNKFQYLSYVDIDEATVLDLSNNEIALWSPEEDSSEELISAEDFVEGDEFHVDSEMLKDLVQEKYFVRTKFVNLAHNKITAIENLSKLHKTVEFNLEGNQLLSISPSNVSLLFPHLRRVAVADNLLTSADLENLRKFNTEYSSHFQLHFQLETTVKSTTRAPFHPLITLPPLIIPTLSPNLFRPAITTQKIIIQTTTPSPKPTSSMPQMESATATNVATENPTTESEDTSSTRTLIEADEPSFPFWLFVIFFITLVVLSLGYCYYREKHAARTNYRNFHEVENFL